MEGNATRAQASSSVNQLSEAYQTTEQSVRSEEHIDDVDASPHQQDVLTPPQWSSYHRLSRPPTLPSATQPTASSSNVFAIQPIQNNFTNNNGQDVHRQLSDSSRSSLTTSSLYQDVLHRRQTPGSNNSPNSSTRPFNHGSLNQLSHRLRTSSIPVFGTHTEIAAHYALPTKLPPTPRINSNSVQSVKPPVPRFNETVPQVEASSSSSQPDFNNLKSNYLQMLSSNPDDNTTVDQSATASFQPLTDMAAANDLASMLIATSPDLWNEYLTSPFDDESPVDNLLATPAQGSAEMGDFFTSPVVADYSLNDPSIVDFPLFPEESPYTESLSSFNKLSVSAAQAPAAGIPTPNFDGMYTLSPATPALDPSSVFHSPQHNDVSEPDRRVRAKVAPTGTRKNISPETLVPLDAPTQPRSYITPSVTSRKELPAVFARKRARSTAFGDEEDELAEEDLGSVPPTGSEADAIAAKRRQNTLAARRSRKRKLEYQRQLEDMVEQERQQKEMWRNRAMLCQAQLSSLGINVPFPPEA